MVENRTERDFLGDVLIPLNAYWGKRTQRYCNNYNISSIKYPHIFIEMIARVKKAAAQANSTAGQLDKNTANLIVKATELIIDGNYLDQFIVDIYTSASALNMNANEVIANIANELRGGKVGEYNYLHPNDQVNRGQSTIDVFPTVMNLVFLRFGNKLLKALLGLCESFEKKGEEFYGIVKVGRTHLMDAHPIRLGDEFIKYKKWLEKDSVRLEFALTRLRTVRIGSSSGTALNVNPDYRKKIIELLSNDTGEELQGLPDVVYADDTSDYLELSSAARSLAVHLIEIANDLRFMNSGPFAGIGEIEFPPTEPGSSFFPGKVNPGIADSVIRVSTQVIGLDTTISTLCHHGELESNGYLPTIAVDLYQALYMLGNVCEIFSKKAINGIKANKDRIKLMLEKSNGSAAALSPYIGYDKATEIARIAQEEHRSIREVVIKKGVLSEEVVDKILDFESLTKNKV